MKQWKRITAFLMVLFLVVSGIPLNNLTSITAKAAGSGVTVDGAPTDWDSLGGVKNVTNLYKGEFAGANISGISVANDADNLYVKVQGIFPNWGDNGMFLDLGIDVADTDLGAGTAAPWGGQYNFDNAPASPDLHILARHNANAVDKIKAVQVKKGNTLVAANDNLNGASFTMGDGSAPAAAGDEYGEIFTASIPLGLLGMDTASGSAIRVIGVISGNNSSEHGAFDVYPKTYDNIAATDYNSSAAPQSMKTYTEYYTLGDKLSVTPSDYVKLGFDYKAVPDQDKTSLGDVRLYSDGRDLYFYADADQIGSNNNTYPVILAFNKNDTDAGTVLTQYASLADLNGLSAKPQYYLEYLPSSGSVALYDALTDSATDASDITVMSTADGVEGKIPLSKLGLAAADTVKVFAMWADKANNNVYSITPHGTSNAFTTDSTAAVVQYSNAFTVPEPLGEPVELIADTFTDLGGEAWYMRGDKITSNGWGDCNEINKLSRLTGDLYAASYVLDADTYEFKAATSDWSKNIGVDASNNFKITLDRKSKVNIYIRTDLGKMWICGMDEYGTDLTSDILTAAGANLVMYAGAGSYTEANWPRLVGTVQQALGEASDWSPSTSKLMLYDYNLNGTEFKYECTMPGNATAYEAKVTCGADWSVSYGSDPDNTNTNLSIAAASTSKVIFTIDLSAAKPAVSATVEAISLDAVKDFPSNGIAADRKSFSFTFSDEISLVGGKDIADSVSISPAAAISSVEISAADAKKLVVTLDSNVTLADDTTYTFTINSGFFETAKGITNNSADFTFKTKTAGESGPAVADEFTGLTTIDKYVVTGNFQKLGGETGTWVPDSKVTQMKRVTGDLYAYSIVLPASKDAVLPNNEKTYQFKVVKNGDYDDPGSFAGGTAAYGNYEFTLDEESKVTIFVNTETHTIAASVDIPNVEYYYYDTNSLPRLVGDIQTLFGEAADSYDDAKQVFYDYYLDGSEYRLERKLGPTTKTLTARASVKTDGVVSDIGVPITLGVMDRAIDTTFKIKNNTLTQEFNIYEPVFSIDTAPSSIQSGTEYQFAASFRDEFRDVTVPDGIVWSLLAPVDGVTLDGSGKLKVDDGVPEDTQITVVAQYTYSNGFTSDLNKTYTDQATVKVVPVVTNFKINYLRYNMDYDGWNLWVWLDGKDGSKYDVFSEKDGWYTGVVSIPDQVNKINFITRKGEWADQEGGDRVFDLTKGQEVWLVQGDKTVYYSKEEAMKPKIFSAVMNSTNRVDFSVSGSGQGVNFSDFTVYVNNKKVSTAAAQGDSATQGVITLMEEVQPSDLVQIIDLSGTYSPKSVTMRGILDSYYYDGDDLGYTKQGNNGSFKVWAPTASKVSLALYSDAGTYNDRGDVVNQLPNRLFDMTRDSSTGVWSIQFPVPDGFPYYMYKVEFADGTVNYAIDPYAKAVSANGQRAAMVDLNTTDPANWKPDSKPATVTYDTDHVLYELHVRDFSIDPDAGFTNKGKFLAFTETGLTDSEGNAIGIDHLKELGVTTVHLLPSYDFRTVNELTVDDPASADRKYNWGYDPQNYNVPEGSYSTDPTDPKARITEFKEMVQALHDADIRVVMDVVYNHTYDIATGPFDKVVPGYYYRINDAGEFSNGSGCGNEVASENPMVRKYIIDSVKYWAKEYNVDGFRFDLFGLIDKETASQLTKELKEEIDPTIVVYGEPWYASSTPLGDGGVSKGAQKDQGYAVFNDNIRGAIKGGSDDATTGFATGATGKESAVVTGIKGSTADFTNSPTETINYVTAHDNLNLWDKVITSQGLNEELNTLYHRMKDGAMLDGSSVDEAVANANPYGKVDVNNIFADETVRRTILANGMVLTMQGVPFIHAGDEFLRSKYGDHNSYRSPDSVNMIRWENKATFKPVADYYAGLLELRKTHPAFRMNTKEAVENNLVICKADGNTIVYALKNHANGDTWNNIVVIYNGNKTSQTVDLGSYGDIAGVADWNIVVNDTQAGCEAIAQTGGKTVDVPGLSMMVLYDSASEVSDNVSDFEPSKSAVTLTPGEEVNVQVVFKNEDGAVLNSGNLTVSSDNEAVAKAVITDTANYNKIKITAKSAGTATITLKARDVKNQRDIVKEIEVTVIGVSAGITPAKASSQDNPVLTVDVGSMDVRTISADLTSVGGSSSYEVSAVTKQISFGIKNYIKAGVKTIPVTITDTAGKKYTVKAEIEVVEPGMGMDWDEAVIYFMLTDRFYDGNTDNNYSLVDKNDPGAYHGGDFAGVTQKLDYLKDLGVNTIWLTPIVENTEGNFSTAEEIAKGNNYYAYHGYWATDFKELNPYLGTKEELCTLIDEAHNRGMKIMVDVVLNHAGYYDNATPLKDQTIMGMLRDESVVDGEEKQWISGLPDFETENQDVRAQLINWQTAWASLQTDRGDSIDYFRVDTVKHVDHETWKQFKTALALNNSEFKLIGEIFDGDAKINSYLNNGEMDSALDFSFKDIARKFVAGGELEAAEAMLEARNARISNTAMLGQFLSSHDEDGFLSETLRGDEAKMMAAVTLQLTAKGQPVIYYGEEIGQSGANNWPVYDNRKDFDWTQVNDQNKMLSHYKNLLQIRSDYSKAFAKGSRRKVAGSDNDGWMVFARSYQTDEVYVAVNTGNVEQEITFATNCAEGTALTDRYSGTAYTVGKDGKVTVTLPAMKDGGTVVIPAKVEWNPSDDDNQGGTNQGGSGSGTGSGSESVTTEKNTTVKEDNSTVETTTTTKVDVNGNKTVEVVEITKDDDGTVMGQTITVTYENKTDGVVVKLETVKDKENKVTLNEATVEAMNPDVVVDKNKAEISMKLPHMLTDIVNGLAGDDAREQLLPITIVIPTEAVKAQLADKNVNEVEVILNQPDSNSNGNVRIESIQIEKEAVQAAQKSGKDLSVTVTDQSGNAKYQWSFDGTLLKKSTVKFDDVNLYLEVVKVNDLSGAAAAIKSLVLKDKSNKADNKAKGVAFTFNHKGLLPATAAVKVYVGDLSGTDTGINSQSNAYLYYYNTRTRKLDELPNNKYKVDKDGYVTINMNHCSSYVLLPEAAAKTITADLLSQITVSPGSKTIYAGGTAGKTTNMKYVLPASLKKVTSFTAQTDPAAEQVKLTFKSSNSKVASVSSTGKITAKKAGKAVITMTAVLPDGTKKSYKATITVAKPSLTITHSKTSMKKGSTDTFTVKANGFAKSEVAWTSSNKSVLTIGKRYGKVTAKAKGTAYITVKAGNVSKKIKVTVK